MWYGYYGILSNSYMRCLTVGIGTVSHINILFKNMERLGRESINS